MKKIQLYFSLLLVVTLSLVLSACEEQATTTQDVGSTDIYSSPTSLTPSTTPAIWPTLADLPTEETATDDSTVSAPTSNTSTTTTDHITATTVRVGKPTATPTIAAVTTTATSTVATHTNSTHTPNTPNPLAEVLRGKPGKKQIAITLDAGSSAVAFPKEIEALDKRSLKLTFFLTGEWVRQNPQYAQRIAADGMEIANHTYDHPYLTKLSDAKVIDEITMGASTIEAVTGVNPKPLFRFPYGDYNGHTMQLLNSLGYRSIYWTYDSLDSVGTHKTAQQLFDTVTSISDAKLDGAIILMHLGNDTSGDALGPIIDNFEQRGFKIVTISKLIQ